MEYRQWRIESSMKRISITTMMMISGLALLVACAGPRQSQAPPSGPVASVHIDALGTIRFDGQPVTLEQLRAKLRAVQHEQGTIRYSRANPSGDPPPNAMEALKAIADLSLPIELAEKPPG
jgi:hypothetical protein